MDITNVTIAAGDWGGDHVQVSYEKNDTAAVTIRIYDVRTLTEPIEGGPPGAPKDPFLMIQGIHGQLTGQQVYNFPFSTSNFEQGVEYCAMIYDYSLPNTSPQKATSNRQVIW